MRAALPWLACVACVPSLDGYRIATAEPDGGLAMDGEVVDATEHDSAQDATSVDAPVSECPSALDCDRGCDELIATVLGESDFEGTTGDISFQAASGVPEEVGGELVLGPAATWVLSNERYPDSVALCAELSLTAPVGAERYAFLFGLRGPEHGFTTRLRYDTERLELAQFLPDVTLVDAMDITIPPGERRSYVVLAYMSSDATYAEVRNELGEVAAVGSTYTGVRDVLQVELYHDADDGAVYVDRILVGRPSTIVTAAQASSR